MKKFIFCVFIILLFFRISESFEFKASIDKNIINQDESVTLRITQSEIDEPVDTAQIKDFKIISQNKSKSVRTINNNLVKFIHYDFLLTPLKDGYLIIPSFKVTIGKTIYQTDEIPIEVKQSEAIKVSDIFLKAQISQNSPYIGEQIIYTIGLYSPFTIKDIKLSPPEFTDFSAKKVEQPKVYHKQTDKIDFEVTEVIYVLIPLKQGNITIQPCEITCEAEIDASKKNKATADSFYGDSIKRKTTFEQKKLKSESLGIKVKPIPKYSDSSIVRFSGIVGEFLIKADISKTKIKVGSSELLSIIIEGTGNITDIIEPIGIFPDVFKIYKQETEELINITEKGINGKKIFKNLLVPLKHGNYSIEAFTISYFDPKLSKYKTVSTSVISMEIIKESDDFNPLLKIEELKKNLAAKADVNFSGYDIFPLKDDKDALQNTNKLSFVFYILLILTSPLFYFCFYFVYSIRQRNEIPSIIMSKKAKLALKDASKNKSNLEKSLLGLYKAVIFAIFSVKGSKGESLTYDEASEILLNAGVSDEYVKKAEELLSMIETLKYSGMKIDNNVFEKLFNETKDFINSV
ncbi:MAG: protein BatD [Desulfobacterales bacterium]|nr:protein BatD [Desulfobacterales bacterium]